MDFHSLARKDLQALCKKNKIPANLTNVAMADALKALHQVEGLNELGNAQQSPEKTTNGDPRTACRASTRRKLVKVEPESSQILTHTRRTTRRAIAGNESNNVNLPETPAPNNRPRGAASASTRRKIDSQLIDCGEDEKLEIKEKSDMAETSAIRSSRKKAPVVSTRRKVETRKDEKLVQRVYGTRQSSVKVLEKTMEELSLKEERKVEAVKIERLCDEIEAKVEPDEYLENECENHEEDSQTNDDEVDQLPKNECEMKHKANEEDNKSEVDFDEIQNIAQFLPSESETKVELPEDSITNDCGSKLETESSANSDNLSGAYIQAETSDKEIDIIHESIGNKDAEITENPENTMNSSDMETESEGKNQNKSNDSSPFAIEADVPDKIADLVNALAAKELLTEDESNGEEFDTDTTDAQIECDSHEVDLEGEVEFDKKTPITSLKERSPCDSSPFAGNTIQGQFPRPTVEEKVIVVDGSIIDKENIENGKENDKLLEMSLRQLTKALKEKLQIKNKNVSKVGSRQALEKLPENAAEVERRSD